MKFTNRLFTLVAIVAFSTSIASAQVGAVKKSELPTATEAAPPVKKAVERDLTPFEVNSLDMTPEQRKQFDEIIAERERSLAEFRGDKSLSKEEVEARVYEKSLYYQRRMNKLLTPEQLKKRGELLAAPAVKTTKAVTQ